MSQDYTSILRQIEGIKLSLSTINEQKSKFISETDVNPQLLRDQRQLEIRLGELEFELAAMPPTVVISADAKHNWQVQKALFEIRAAVTHTHRQLRYLIEYKGAHDLLQQLELQYWFFHTHIFDFKDDILSEEINWSYLKVSLSILRSTILRTCEAAERMTLISDRVRWKNELQEICDHLMDAFNRQDLTRFAEGISELYSLLSIQTSRMNDHLVITFDSLQLNDLMELIAKSRKIMNIAQLDISFFAQTSNNQSHANISVLAQVTTRLTLLRNEHDIWQAIDNHLRQERNQIISNLHRFTERWKRNLGPKMRATCKTQDENWSRELNKLLNDLEDALAKSDSFAAVMTFDDCRRAALLRFNSIDIEMRRLSNLLNSAGGPLNIILENLS